MTDTLITEMNNLRDSLAAGPMGIETELTTFPSGSAMLDVRRGGRAFVMAYSPNHGFGVDELHPDDGFGVGYKYTYEQFDRAAQQLRAMALPEIPMPPIMSLIVLRSANIESAKEFYSLLGMSFTEEQHGKGPRHYATIIGSMVLEIYPCQSGLSESPLRIGFRVPALDRTIDAIRSRGMRILHEAGDTPWGRRAVVEDPDGNCVELTSLS